MIINLETKVYPGGVTDLLFTDCPVGKCPTAPKAVASDADKATRTAYDAAALAYGNHMASHRTTVFGAEQRTGVALEQYAQQCAAEIKALSVQPVVTANSALLAKVTL